MKRPPSSTVSGIGAGGNEILVYLRWQLIADWFPIEKNWKIYGVLIGPLWDDSTGLLGRDVLKTLPWCPSIAPDTVLKPERTCGCASLDSKQERNWRFVNMTRRRSLASKDDKM
jgi:hypothetical protein